MSEFQTVLGAISGEYAAWGYVGIFVILILTTILPLPLPEELISIVTGYLIAVKMIDPALGFLTLVAGILAGDLYQFYLARFLGIRLLVLWPFRLFITESAIAKAREFIAGHGAKAIIFGRLIYGLRSNVHFALGILRYPAKKFIIADSAVIVIQALALTLAGFYGKPMIEGLAEQIMAIQRIIFFGIIGFFCSGTLYLIFAALRKSSVVDA